MRLLAFLALAVPPAWAEVDPGAYRAGFEDCITGAGIDEEALWNCVGVASGVCQDREDGGASTVGIMFCDLMELELWDDRLNAVYKQQIAAAKVFDAEQAQYQDGVFAVLEESLRDAQRAWIPFRDAQCTLEYAQWGAGSMRQVAGAGCHLRMTAERVIYLMTSTQTIAAE